MSVPDLNLTLNFLGGFEALLGGRPISGFSYNKMRALLAYLAVEREQDHNREALAALLWSDNSPATARGNLRRTLSNLRQAVESPLGKTLFLASKHTIRFIPNCHIDALNFAGRNFGKPSPVLSEEEIIDLYRGEFLAGLSLPDCPDFEGWLQIQRESMHRRVLALLERLSNQQEKIGAYGKALQFALRYIELDPWNENSHRRTMLLYALNGQDGAAIAQYESCCRLLKNELGVLPEEETRRLAERIRNGELLIRHELAPASPLARNPVVAGLFLDNSGDGAQQIFLPHEPDSAISLDRAERRQATVLYCELSVAGSDDLDEAMELLHAPQARCVEIIRQLSGHLMQTHGGGLLAYFGYPQAREDAANRAVQAALAVTREADQAIEIRAGVHTGMIITRGDSSMPDTVGKASNIAIQLRHSAAPNKVAISRETRNLVGGYFDCISLGMQALPGLAHPLEIFNVARESGARTRLDAAPQLTPLVGRKAEIAQLAGLWEETRQGARHVVLIQGEAGIGKSRLLHTLKTQLDGQPHAIRELRCFPEFSQSPLYPFIAMFEALSGFSHGDTHEEKSAKLVRYLEANYPETAQEAIPLLAQLLSLPFTGACSAPDLAPQELKDKTFAILLDTLQALAKKHSALLVVEDLHWIDPSTQELLTLFVDQAESHSILTLFTARPEFVPPWKAHNGSTLTLAPLVDSEVEALLLSLSDDIPAATLWRIVERADGIPMFAEEMARMASIDNRANVPATLHDLLATRLDGMGEAKSTAQLAASIGREFGLDLLRKAAPNDPAALSRSMRALLDAGLILRVDESTCHFKHALIQEVAYQSQTKANRQAAHRRIAQILQSDFPDIVTARPELLAQHFSAGGETRQSHDWWLRAGKEAAAHCANTEAIGHFSHALDALASLPGGTSGDELELLVLVELGSTLIASKGYGSPEADHVYKRALALSEKTGVSLALFRSIWGLYLGCSSRTNHRDAMGLAERLLELARQDGSPTLQIAARYACTNSSYSLGRFAETVHHMEAARKLYVPELDTPLISLFGEHVQVCALQFGAWAQWVMGKSEASLDTAAEALAIARRIDHPYTLCFAYCLLGILHRMRGDADKVRENGAALSALATKQGFTFWQVVGNMLEGWAQAAAGEPGGASRIAATVDILRHSIFTGAIMYFLEILADARRLLGQHEEQLEATNLALEVMERLQDIHYKAEIYRLKGDCLLELSPANMEEAEACFGQALAVSRKQGAKSLELRAATDMARLWQRQGKPQDARDLLAESYHFFSECFDSPDVREARKLLEELG